MLAFSFASLWFETCKKKGDKQVYDSRCLYSSKEVIGCRWPSHNSLTLTLHLRLIGSHPFLLVWLHHAINARLALFQRQKLLLSVFAPLPHQSCRNCLFVPKFEKKQKFLPVRSQNDKNVDFERKNGKVRKREREREQSHTSEVAAATTCIGSCYWAQFSRSFFGLLLARSCPPKTSACYTHFRSNQRVSKFGGNQIKHAV